MLGTKNNKNNRRRIRHHLPNSMLGTNIIRSGAANKHSMLVKLNTTYLKQPSTFFFLECYIYMLKKFKDFLGPLEAGRGREASPLAKWESVMRARFGPGYLGEWRYGFLRFGIG